jgi:hypothetical protein
MIGVGSIVGGAPLGTEYFLEISIPEFTLGLFDTVGVEEKNVSVIDGEGLYRITPLGFYQKVGKYPGAGVSFKVTVFIFPSEASYQ